MFDVEQFSREGYAITSPLFNQRETQETIAVLEQQKKTDGGPRRGGLCDVLDNVPAVRTLANHPGIREIVAEVLGPEAFVVRATLFDKTEASNWKVPWHQDVTIAVRERYELEGYGPWSIKAGVTHVQPPTEVLQQMVTVRVHLDDCPSSNGALRVMPGTHLLGRLNQNEVAPYIDEDAAVCCEAAAGEALVMRPLLLHASSASTLPSHRRVVHFDFAACKLPKGLLWALE